MPVKKGGLGRGLESLFNENAEDSEGVVRVKLSEIEPNKGQPRKSFDEQALGELSDSIKKHGLLQPIIVCPMANGSYRIIAGERRWRACRMAELTEVPVIVKQLDERSLMEIALIENLQREDLNAVEEALGYRSLIESYGLTQEQVAESMGKSRSAVTNALRLLSLTETELEALRIGKISAGHARALLSCDNTSVRERMLYAAVNGASVRELERAAAASKKNDTAKHTKKIKNNFYSEVELSLRNEMHRRVTVKPDGNGRGTITFEFFSEDELTELARRLTAEE